jgi:hypothetical protein
MGITRQRIKVILVSEGIDQNEASKIGFKVFNQTNDALDYVLKQKGEEVKIGIVTHGGDMMFRINKVK